MANKHESLHHFLIICSRLLKIEFPVLKENNVFLGSNDFIATRKHSTHEGLLCQPSFFFYEALLQ